MLLQMLLQFYILIYFKMLCIPVIKAEFSVSHDPSEIVLMCWFIIIGAENSCAA